MLSPVNVAAIPHYGSIQQRGHFQTLGSADYVRPNDDAQVHRSVSTTDCETLHFHTGFRNEQRGKVKHIVATFGGTHRRRHFPQRNTDPTGHRFRTLLPKQLETVKQLLTRIFSVEIKYWRISFWGMMPNILRIYHTIHWECSLVTNHQVSQKMWFFTLLVKPLGKILSPLIIVWQQLMPYVHSKGVPLKVELINAVEAGWCYTKGISTSTNSWILLQQTPYCFNINFGTHCFWPARICLVSVETCSVIVVLPDVF